MEKSEKVLTMSDLHELFLEKTGIDITVQRIKYYIDNGLLPFKQEGENGLWIIDVKELEEVERSLMLIEIGVESEDIKNATIYRVEKRIEVIKKLIGILDKIYNK